jgi:HEPN domain-containing protein
MEPYDPVLFEDVRAWLTKAAIDLRGAEIDLEAEPPLLEDALFHCQQAVEKSFKAFLVFHNQPFRRTHNLEEIGEACLQLDGTLRQIVDNAVPLSEYAWAYRYPGAPLLPEMEEVQSTFTIAQSAYRLMLERVPIKAHPIVTK